MVMDAAALHAELTEYLIQASIPDAAFDVRCMIEQVTGCRYEKLLLTGIPAEDESPLRNMAQRRAFGEPLQYILGEWEFFGMRLFVGKGVLIPRPDTEVLVENVLHWCKGKQELRVLDLCTGSGCIALALQKHLPDAQVHALDLSEDALAYARRNAAYHRLPVILHQGNALTVQSPQEFGSFDVIVSNPPYLTAQEMTQLQREIRFEPASALAAGEDGLTFYRSITSCWKAALRPGGLLAYEIGEQQGEAVSGILQDNGFSAIQILKDYAHHDRVVTGIK
ncbi:MAG: peptide chain release factor N(5)-glutamine methyltransferase [Oscillospiraceae bacterium]|nr:peptide chain release factor N(5)-glutamine methyltransferase [Oscillospiraceae bacterium]